MVESHSTYSVSAKDVSDCPAPPDGYCSDTPVDPPGCLEGQHRLLELSKRSTTASFEGDDGHRRLMTEHDAGVTTQVDYKDSDRLEWIRIMLLHRRSAWMDITSRMYAPRTLRLNATHLKMKKAAASFAPRLRKHSAAKILLETMPIITRKLLKPFRRKKETMCLLHLMCLIAVTKQPPLESMCTSLGLGEVRGGGRRRKWWVFVTLP